MVQEVPVETEDKADTEVPAEEALAEVDKVCMDCKEYMGYNSFYSSCYSCCGCSDSLGYTT